MLFRKFRLDWSYAIGELFIVVAGVLIALAIDQWNADRIERREEREAIANILGNLDTDLYVYDFVTDRVTTKISSLRRLRRDFESGDVDDAERFLTDVLRGADFGWNQDPAYKPAYDDLLGAGKLGIIRSDDIRFAIAFYYESVENELPRMDARETEYPNMTYRLVPRQPAASQVEQVVEEHTIDPGLGEEERAALVRSVLASSLGDLLVAEENLGNFILRLTLKNRRHAEDLIERLEAYSQEIR